MSRPPVLDLVLDVDTGVDDALALLLAVHHPRIALHGVTCVAGNATLPDVVANTRAVLAAAGAAHVPVAGGADRPLTWPDGVPPPTPSGRHGGSGLGSARVPRPRASEASGGRSRGLDPGSGRGGTGAQDLLDAVIERAASRARPVRLACLGPQTNLALLLRRCPVPLLATGLAGVLVVAGGDGPRGDANTAWDPDAAAEVTSGLARAGVPLLRYGMAVLDLPRVPAAVGDPLADQLLAAQGARLGIAPGVDVPLGDAGAVAALALGIGDRAGESQRGAGESERGAGEVRLSAGEAAAIARCWTGVVRNSPGPAGARAG